MRSYVEVLYPLGVELCQGESQRSSFILFSCWNSVFPVPFVENAVVSDSAHFLCFYKKSGNCNCVDLHLGPLIYFTDFISWLCSMIWNRVLWYLLQYSFCSDCFYYPWSFVFPYKFLELLLCKKISMSNKLN